MDERDHQLLTLLQQGIPLKEHSFAVLGQRLRLDPAEVLVRIGRLKEQGVIREIRAVFDGSKLGFHSSLVAMQFSDELKYRALSLLRDHPAVSHLEEKHHDWNIWFSLTLPVSDSLEEHLAELKETVCAEKALSLPALKWFTKEEVREAVRPMVNKWTRVEKRIIRALQEEFPLTDEPFQVLAEKLEIRKDVLYFALEALQKRGGLRGIKALVAQEETEEMFNTLIAWRVPEEREERVGMKLASLPGVLHCVKRPVYRDFPYSLYTTVRVSKALGSHATAGQLAAEAGSWPHVELPSESEYKHHRIYVFEDELEQWRREHTEQEPAVPGGK